MLLILGADSEIGAATCRHIEASGGMVVGTTRRQSAASSNSILLDFDRDVSDFSPPDGVTAACIFVAVARLAACAADPQGSAKVNCERTISLVQRLTARGVYTLFLSTNQVFDGELAHVSADAPASPVSEYGRQKALTEDVLRRQMADGAPIGILRFAKIVSPRMALIEAWKAELAAGRPVDAFVDMMMAPTPVAHAAAAIVCLMRDRQATIAQLTGPRDVAYREVGRLVARRVGADPGLVRPVSALDKGMPLGSTPHNTTLDSSYLADRYDIVVPDVEEVLGDIV
jgi:dTDP-4-dehydrorhamnose reductase